MKVSRNKERIVAIVGRPTVGKSALSNRPAGPPHRHRARHARGHARPPNSFGEGHQLPLQMMDTGGIGATLNVDLGDMVRIEAEIAIAAAAAAAAILFVVDALSGMDPIDEFVAQMLRRQDVR